MTWGMVAASLIGGVIGALLASVWMRWCEEQRRIAQRKADATLEQAEQAFAEPPRGTDYVHAQRFLAKVDQCTCRDCTLAFINHRPRPHGGARHAS